MDIDKQVTQIVQEVIGTITDNIQQQVMTVVQKQINDITKNIDYHALFQAAITAAVTNKQFVFPDASIPVTAVDTTDLIISGDQIRGGIITRFGSTGIEDQATDCQLTIMDSATVIENNLLTQDLTVKGTATIEGDLIVTGTVPESSPMFQQFVASASTAVRGSIDQSVFAGYASMVVDSIRTNGLDLTKITVNGQEAISGGNLGNQITSSNLQKVGILQELQVQGETLLSQSLYTTNKRVGINTIEPANALSVWDQEIEIGVGKQSSGVGFIGTPRNQTLVLSSNNKNNLTLTPDGGVTVNQLTLGGTTMTSSDTPPSTNQPRGTLVFNNNPTLGGPLGWVSLGDAKWANFGYVD